MISGVSRSGSTLTNKPLQFVAIWPSNFLAQLGQRGGANIRALRVPEKHHHQLASKVGQLAGLAVVVGQRGTIGVVGPVRSMPEKAGLDSDIHKAAIELAAIAYPATF